MIPTKLFLTKGVGIADYPLLSFEMALRDAGISPYNLVKVSSIIPPGCKIISKEEGIKMLKPGEIVYLVLSRVDCNEAKLISASIGLALPNDSSVHGYLSEYESVGEDEKKAAETAEKLAVSMLKTLITNEKIKIYSKSITQSATSKNGKWTTVLSAAVFVP